MPEEPEYKTKANPIQMEESGVHFVLIIYTKNPSNAVAVFHCVEDYDRFIKSLVDNGKKQINGVNINNIVSIQEPRFVESLYKLCKPQPIKILHITNSTGRRVSLAVNHPNFRSWSLYCGLPD